jgi:peptide/nickel transport system ATP-binding protein
MAEMTATAEPRGAIEGSSDDVVQVRDLHVHFKTSLGTTRALNGVSFNIPRGKVLGVVGESGCGKSMTGLSILQLVPRPGRIVSGEIVFRESPTAQPVNLLEYDRQGPEMR